MYALYVCAICKSLMAWMIKPVFGKEHGRVPSVLIVLSD